MDDVTVSFDLPLFLTTKLTLRSGERIDVSIRADIIKMSPEDRLVLAELFDAIMEYNEKVVQS